MNSLSGRSIAAFAVVFEERLYIFYGNIYLINIWDYVSIKYIEHMFCDYERNILGWKSGLHRRCRSWIN